MAENEVPTGKEWDQAVEDQRSGDPAKAGQAYETLSYDSQQIEKADGGGEEIDLGGPAKEEEKGAPDTDPGVHDHSDGGVHNYDQQQEQEQDQQREAEQQPEQDQNQTEQNGPELTPEDQKQEAQQDLDEPEPVQDQNQQQEQGSSIFDQQMEAGDDGDRFFGDADAGDGLLAQLTDHTAQLAEDFMSAEGGQEPENQQPDQQQQTGDISAALDNMQQSLGEAQDRVDQSNQRESEMDQQQDKQAQEQSQDQQQDKGGSDSGMEMSQ